MKPQIAREEEIKLVASCHIAASNEDFKEYYEGFIAGAEWADKTMIEKACSILEDMTEGRLGKRFISEFKNKLKYGVLERH